MLQKVQIYIIQMLDLIQDLVQKPDDAYEGTTNDTDGRADARIAAASIANDVNLAGAVNGICLQCTLPLEIGSDTDTGITQHGDARYLDYATNLPIQMELMILSKYI